MKNWLGGYGVPALSLPIVVGSFAVAAWSFSEIRDNTDKRINENQELIQRIDQTRYVQCIEAEIRDVVQVQQAQAILAVLRKLPRQTPATRNLIEVYEDGINALEPPGELPCMPPTGTSP